MNLFAGAGPTLSADVSLPKRGHCLRSRSANMRPRPRARYEMIQALNVKLCGRYIVLTRPSSSSFLDSPPIERCLSFLFSDHEIISLCLKGFSLNNENNLEQAFGGCVCFRIVFFRCHSARDQLADDKSSRFIFRGRSEAEKIHKAQREQRECTGSSRIP